VLYKENNYIIEYKGELSRKSSKKQFYISKSRRKGKAVKYNIKGGNRIKVMALTVDIKVEA
jgi:hypothetical protein